MTVTDALYLAAGVVFVAVGAALLATRRRHSSAVAIAVYVTGLGALYFTYGIWGNADTPAVVRGGLALTAASGLAAFALLFPTPLAGKAWLDAAFAGAYATAFIIVLTWLHRGSAAALLDAQGGSGLAAVLISVSFSLIAIVSIATTLLLPLRAARLAPDEGDAMRAIGMIAVALLLVSPGGPFPGIVAAARGEVPLLTMGLILVTAVVSSGLWVRATRGHHARAARNILLTLVALDIGLGIVHRFAGDLVVQIGRLLSALFLAYAVVAGQIPGLDVKVRFAISKSTIAAAFVAAFFVASEGAQILFGQGNEWVGLLGAGALVFALAPLQRAAERLAERAVPHGAPEAAPAAGSRAEAAYTAVLERYLRDGTLTRDEERALAALAGELRLDAGRAFELRERVEHDMLTTREAE